MSNVFRLDSYDVALVTLLVNSHHQALRQHPRSDSCGTLMACQPIPKKWSILFPKERTHTSSNRSPSVQITFPNAFTLCLCRKIRLSRSSAPP